MSEQSQSEAIEISMEEAKHYVENRDQMNRLIANPDFDKLITQGYLDKEAARLVLAKAEPNMQSDESQQLLDKQINAIGYVRLYIRTIIQYGDMAERDITASKAELEIAEQEELDAVAGD